MLRCNVLRFSAPCLSLKLAKKLILLIVHTTNTPLVERWGWCQVGGIAPAFASTQTRAISVCDRSVATLTTIMQEIVCGLITYPLISFIYFCDFSCYDGINNGWF